MKAYAPIRVMIADDHEIYRDGLKIMLKKQEEIELVGEAENGREAIEKTPIVKPEVILMDIVMPIMDGIKATAHLRDHYPSSSVIALSMFNEDNLVIDMLDAGAKGFLLKNAHKSEIVEAIRSIHKEEPYYCKSTTVKLAKMLAKSRYNPYQKSAMVTFSEKEMEIILLICQEHTSKEIAEKLFMSHRTVEGHRLRIMEKMKVKSAAGIVVYAIDNSFYKLG